MYIILILDFLKIIFKIYEIKFANGMLMVLYLAYQNYQVKHQLIFSLRF